MGLLGDTTIRMKMAGVCMDPAEVVVVEIGGGVEEGEIGIIGDRIEGTMKETITITMRGIIAKMVTNLSMRVMKHLDSIVVAMVVFLLIGTI